VRYNDILNGRTNKSHRRFSTSSLRYYRSVCKICDVLNLRYLHTLRCKTCNPHILSSYFLEVVKRPLASLFGEEIDLNREILRISQARVTLFNLLIETDIYFLLELTRGNQERRSMSLRVRNYQATMGAFCETISSTRSTSTIAGITPRTAFTARVGLIKLTVASQLKSSVKINIHENGDFLHTLLIKEVLNCL
jgi:hypothetical protein